MTVGFKEIVQEAITTKPLSVKPDGAIDSKLIGDLILTENLNPAQTLDDAALRKLATHMADRVGNLPGTELGFLAKLFKDITGLLSAFSEKRQELDTSTKHQEYSSKLAAEKDQYIDTLNQAITSLNFTLKTTASNKDEKTVEMELPENRKITLRLLLKENGSYNITATFLSSETSPFANAQTPNERSLDLAKVNGLEAALKSKDPSVLSLPTDLGSQDQLKVYTKFLEGISYQIHNLLNGQEKGSYLYNLLKSFSNQISRVLQNKYPNDIAAFQTNTNEGRFFRNHGQTISNEAGIQAFGVADIVRSRDFIEQLSAGAKYAYNVPEAYKQFKELIAGIKVDENFQPFLNVLVKKIEARATDCPPHFPQTQS